jgi:hypothetical protein
VTIKGYENYSTAILGKINILFAAPHGGWDRPNMIAKMGPVKDQGRWAQWNN